MLKIILKLKAAETDNYGVKKYYVYVGDLEQKNFTKGNPSNSTKN